MLTWLENIDIQILLAINGAHNSVLDSIMWTISEEWFGVPFYLFFIFLLYKHLGTKATLLAVGCLVLAVGLSDLSAKYLFKEVFLRYRPSRNLELGSQLHLVNGYTGGWYGFVSSHAANMFTLGMLIFLILKEHIGKVLYLIFAWAGLIGYSRIYLGVHYPSDVTCGALLGMTIGFIVFRIFRQLKTKI
jgi:undecaprenyl-diphosphatase